jgi:NitT/TauT family transport system permease protein
MSAVLDPRPRRRLVHPHVGDGLVVVVLAVAIWEALFLYAGESAISSPLRTLAYAAALVLTANFWGHVGATFLAFFDTLLISTVAGLSLGLWFGIRRFAGDVAEPLLAGFYTIPKVTLYPVILLLFGLGLSAKVAFGVIHGTIPIVLFTMAAVRTLPPVLVRTARTLRLNVWQTATTVVGPAVLPEIVNGLRVGFALSLLGVLIGEMFASQRGLGFLLISGISGHNVPLTTSVTLIIIVFAIGANTLLLRLSRKH